MGSKLIFTGSQLRSAWRKFEKLTVEDENGRLLLKFYAVECGLKAVLMKQKKCRKTSDRGAQKIVQCGHDINKLLQELRTGNRLNLKPANIKIKEYNQEFHQKVEVSQLNQMWRYGGVPEGETDNSYYVESLDKINSWIREKI